jgi:prepilin-type N-terminal cleavage/methylation domain-containing protein
MNYLIKRSRRQRGFTLMELLVVVAIIIVISALMLASTNKFGGESQLQNLAYDIALSVREAQVYGISVQRVGTSGTNFNAGYGMHFDMANYTTYNLFADVAQDGLYQVTYMTTPEDVQPSPYSIGQGFYISKLCATPISTGTEICTGSSPTSVTRLDILFIRPEPDAYISINGLPPLTFDSNNNVIGGSQYSQARIVVGSPRGDFMSVVISTNGQITVNNTN